MEITLKISFVSLLCLAVVACNSVASELTVEVKTEDPAITRLAIKELSKLGVEFEQDTETELRVAPENAEKVIQVLKSVARDMLPEGRHGALTDNVRTHVVDQLKEEGIPFETIYLFGDTWIVWEEQDTSRVESIIREAARAERQPE